jgi:16S rRNA (cytosine1402-N4)-methyltransferase
VPTDGASDGAAGGVEGGGAERPHAPVLVDVVTDFLGGRDTVVDMTVGAGGHAEALLAHGVRQVIGVDRDPEALSIAAERLAPFGDRLRLVRSTFAEVDLEGPVDGVLFDLGVSSMQLDRAGRGFGYRQDGPLDMRMGGEGPTAADLVNELPEEELANLIFEFGGEHRSRRIARAIVRARERSPIETTDVLARVVAGALGRRPGGPHPARRTFQALRIAVNRELEELAASLPQAVELLAPGGRVVVLAYHSLEDRIVKRLFLEDERLLRLTKKPVMPGEAEIAANPRARSAKLRAAERVEVAA